MIGLHVVHGAQPSSPTGNGARGRWRRSRMDSQKKTGAPKDARLQCYGGEARIRTGGKGFAGLCLTTWPLRRKRTVKNGPEMQWSGQRGSNPRPQPWQGCALPTEPCPHVVGDTRFELVTPSVSGKCSPPELIARLRCAPQRGINYSRAEFQMQQHFSKFLRSFGFPW